MDDLLKKTKKPIYSNVAVNRFLSYLKTQRNYTQATIDDYNYDLKKFFLFYPCLSPMDFSVFQLFPFPYSPKTFLFYNTTKYPIFLHGDFKKVMRYIPTIPPPSYNTWRRIT